MLKEIPFSWPKEEAEKYIQRTMPGKATTSKESPAAVATSSSEVI